MLRAIVVVLCLAAADAGLRIGKPSGAGALKMATREEEKKAEGLVDPDLEDYDL